MKNIMKRVMTLTIIVSMLFPNITAKASGTQYIDVFIPRFITHTYERGERIIYDPDGKLQEASSKNWITLDGPFQTEVNTDFPNANNYFTYGDNKYNSFEELKNNEVGCKYTVTVDYWNEIEKIINNNDITYKYYDYYVKSYYPKRTYYYDQYVNQTVLEDDPNCHHSYHSFLSYYDYYFINGSLCQPLNYKDASPEYITSDFAGYTAGQVQPINNYKRTGVTWQDDKYIEYQYPVVISEPYTGEKNYQTDVYETLWYQEHGSSIGGEDTTTEQSTTQQPTTQTATTESSTKKQPTTEKKTEKTTETNKTEKETSVPISKGTVLSINGTSYKVTSSSTKNSTVSYLGTTNKSTTIKVPDTIKTNGITYKVTSIAKSAFENSNVKSVTIGKNVQTIDSSAFKNCKKLTTVTIKNRTTITIKDNAFYGCKKLKTVKIYSSKVSIKKNSFKNTSKTLKVYVRKTIKSSTVKKNLIKTAKANKNVKVKNTLS